MNQTYSKLISIADELVDSLTNIQIRFLNLIFARYPLLHYEKLLSILKTAEAWIQLNSM